MSHIKKLKNTTISDIELKETGILIPASGEYVLEVTEYLLWATVDSITEITPYINSGDIVVNDGTTDLSAAEGIRYLEYADRAYIQKDGVDVTRVNKVLNFIGSGVTVVDDGNGKTNISVEDSVNQLYFVRCLSIPGCSELYYTNVSPLIDHTLCFIKKENC